MKRFARKLILFFLVLAIAYVLGLLLCSNGPLKNKVTNVKNLTGAWGNSLERFREAEHVDSVDILFAGSSHTYRGFDTRIFRNRGISCFNLGSSGQTPYNTHFLLRNYLGKMHPKTIIMDVYWGLFASPDGAEATIDIICNSPYSRGYLNMALHSGNILVYNSVLADVLNKTLRPLSRCSSPPDPMNTYVQGGFVENHYRPNIDSVLGKLHSVKAVIQPLQLEYLEKNISLIRSRGIRLIVVLTPVLPQWKASMINYRDFTARIRTLCSRHGAAFRNYNDDEAYSQLGLDMHQDFYDKDHLSQSGVEKFNRAVLNDLRKGL